MFQWKIECLRHQGRDFDMASASRSKEGSKAGNPEALKTAVLTELTL